jgi:hypothetical protein
MALSCAPTELKALEQDGALSSALACSNELNLMISRFARFRASFVGALRLPSTTWFSPPSIHDRAMMLCRQSVASIPIDLLVTLTSRSQ